MTRGVLLMGKDGGLSGNLAGRECGGSGGTRLRHAYVG